MDRYSYWLIALLALWVAAAGTSHIPLNGHEVYVAETAREMQVRGDWLIPYFNGELRLNKPPINYWLTGAVAWLAGQQEIQDWHARAVSALAATGLALLTLTLGRWLYSDRRVGLLGSLLLISSLGFFTFSHDARPDMLYAWFCSAGYTALAIAWRRQQAGQSTRLPCYAMWLAFALATLTKGPHLPAILLVAAAGFFHRRQRLSWRAIAGLLRPVGGLLLLAFIAGPWWWYLRRHVGADSLSHSQLGGALLTIDWRQLLNPYHFLRALQLLAPWSLLLPIVLVMAWRQRRLDEASLWLLVMVCVAALILGFGSQRRWFYMLPLLPALCLLTAEGLLLAGSANILSAGSAGILPASWGRGHCFGKLRTGTGRSENATPGPASETERSSSQRWLTYAHLFLWLLITLGCGYLFFRPGCCDAANLPKLIAALSLAGAWLVVPGFYRPARASWTAYLGSTLTLALMLITLSDSPALWSPDRFYLLNAVKTAAPHIDADTPAVALDENPMAYIFYLRRTVQRVEGLPKLDDYLRQTDRPVLVIVDSNQVTQLPAAWPAKVLAKMPDDAEEPKTLLLLSGR